MRFKALTLLWLALSIETQAAPRDWCRWALSWIAGSPQTVVRLPEVDRAQGPETAQTKSQQSHRFDELSSRLDFLLGVLREHPNLVTSNLSFRRSLLETLSGISELQKHLGTHAAPMDVTPPHFVRAKYLPSGDFKYDEAKVSEFLGKRVEELSG